MGAGITSTAFKGISPYVMRVISHMGDLFIVWTCPHCGEHVYTHHGLRWYAGDEEGPCLRLQCIKYPTYGSRYCVVRSLLTCLCCPRHCKNTVEVMVDPPDNLVAREMDEERRRKVKFARIP